VDFKHARPLPTDWIFQHSKFEQSWRICSGVIVISICSVWVLSVILDLTGSGLSQFHGLWGPTACQTATQPGNGRLSYWAHFPRLILRMPPTSGQISGMHGPNCIKFGKNIEQSSVLTEFVWDFRYLASIWIEGASVASGVENWSQIMHLLLRVKIIGRVGEMFEWKFPNHHVIQLTGSRYAVWLSKELIKKFISKT